ncbi:TadE/TadG family type IV pilus assembly protein [Nocardioides houyundeii]|uniref:TadE/TadG family type IV pilus assembly protein n=1 Tax=Nocardioides houyundeii TaxID=2045452 RepID=UPI000C772FAB|nr:TadE/TadG family type IV pilus assembly protein [Nocardioides houyundeii]
MPARTPGHRGEQGAAVVDFVLVLVILLPLFLGILQLALVLHVRNTMASAAAEGARYAATWQSSPEDGIAKARAQIEGVVSQDFAADPTIEVVDIDGAPAYRMTIDVTVPTLGLGGPGVSFQVSGNAIIEPDPDGGARAVGTAELAGAG